MSSTTVSTGNWITQLHEIVVEKVLSDVIDNNGNVLVNQNQSILFGGNVSMYHNYQNDRNEILVKLNGKIERTFYYVDSDGMLVIELPTIHCQSLSNQNIVVQQDYTNSSSIRYVTINNLGIQMSDGVTPLLLTDVAIPVANRKIDIAASTGTILAEEFGNRISGIHLTRFGLLKNVYPDGSVYALYNRYNPSINNVEITYKLLDRANVETNAFNILIDNYELLNTSNGTCSLPKFVDFVLSNVNDHSYFRVDCEGVIQNNVEIFFNYNMQNINSIQLRFQRTDNSTNHAGRLGFYFGVFFNETSTEILSKTITTYRYRTSTPNKVGFAPQRALAPS